MEILPNWHPVFVHFTVALFSTAFIFYVIGFILSRSKFISQKLVLELESVGRWCLWLAALMTIFTVIAGLHAYNTVRHDAASHHAMTIHRNWALSTAGMILLVTVWSLREYFKNQKATLGFIFILIVAQCLLLITAWHGGELVYRHGLGVISLPQFEELTHQHNEEMLNNLSGQPMPAMEVNQSNHEHQHG